MSIPLKNYSNHLLKFLDFFVLSVIGLFSVLYAVGFSSFAELHITFSFLDFPIFVGEILLAVSVVLLGIKWTISKQVFSKWHILLFLYVGWFILKALGGYYIYGPLSFRTAALFYYPLFAVIAYHFYTRQFFRQPMILLLWLLLAVLIGFNKLHIYFWWPCYLLLIILVIQLRDKWLKRSAFIISILLFRYGLLFDGPRNHLLGCLIAFLFLSSSLLFIFTKIHLRQKLLVSGSILVLLVFAAFQLADQNALKSLTTPSQVIERWKKEDARIAQKREGFAMLNFPAQLYNKNIKTAGEMKEYDATLETSKILVDGDRLKKISKGFNKGKIVNAETNEQEFRSLDIAYSNILFRLFIWRDMLVDLLATKSILGMSFGHPQRSISLEVLGWAETEWMRDGWITPHNSYLHVLYRAGLLGVFFLFVFFGRLLDMLRQIIVSKSIIGILIASIFMYWTMIANFLVFFEMPYHAIPFWSLLGVSLAYLKENSKVLRGEYDGHNES